MSWRTILIQNPAKISLKLGQLLLKNEDGKYSVPLEDITVVILDSPQIILSSSLISAMQEFGIMLISCDKTHMPNGILQPFLPHSRNAQVAAMQIGWSVAFRKRLWQRIVKKKIENQAECLKRSDSDEWINLIAMVKNVRSGDEGNVEAQAARYYWQRLFGKDFRRSNDDIINAALNYSYAVIRACVARSLVAYGLIPVFGIHHDNNLNAFNLVDDIMEILRPFADYKIWKMHDNSIFATEDKKLSSANRADLAAISGADVEINGEIFTLTAACDKMAMTLVSSIREKEHSQFQIVDFPPFFS